jgi:hypothetical protein
MKKFLLAALAVFFAATSWASGPTVPLHQKVDNVMFRSQVAANASAVWDSLVTRRVGAAGTSSVLDTTVAISTEGWLRPQGMTGAATDTSQVWLALHVAASVDGGDAGCQSGADSLAVAMQVSVDGQTWITTAAVPGQTASAGANPITSRNNQTIVNGAFKDALSLNGAALANGQPAWVFKYRFRGVNQLSAIDCDNAIDYPFIRFIFSFHDAAGYMVKAKIVRPSTVD